MVATYTPPSFPTQTPTVYKGSIDAGFQVNKRLMDAFAPHAQATPDMTIALDAGFTFYNQTLTEVAAQNTAAISASSLAGITRIDRVVINRLTGAYSLVAGTSLAPAIPYGFNPCAQVAVTTGSTAITNAMITDERAFPATPRLPDYQVFNTTGASTWTKPDGFSTNARVLVLAWAGGAGGSTNGGGGGGAFLQAQYRLSDLSSSHTVTVAAGGAPGKVGGNTSFGSLFTVYGGGASTAASGGNGSGGGGIYSVGVAGTNDGGDPSGGTAVGDQSNFGGGAGGNSGTAGAASVYGGGGGGGGSTSGSAASPGGASFYGGGGGGGFSTVAGSSVTGGASVMGGAGGIGSTIATTTSGSGTVPGGGGGGGLNNPGSGARGEVRVWVFPS